MTTGTDSRTVGGAPTAGNVTRSASLALLAGFVCVEIMTGFSGLPATELLRGLLVFAPPTVLVVASALVLRHGSRGQVVGASWAARTPAQESVAIASDEAEWFELLVRDSIARLPPHAHVALEHVAVEISRLTFDRAYGVYVSDPSASDTFRETLVIFRDSLLRDCRCSADDLQQRVDAVLRSGLALRRAQVAGTSTHCAPLAMLLNRSGGSTEPDDLSGLV